MRTLILTTVLLVMACAILSASPVSADVTRAKSNTGSDDPAPQEAAPTEEQKLPWREQMEQDRRAQIAAEEAQVVRETEAQKLQRKHDEQVRALFYGTQPTPIRVLYDPVWCNEYERTGGPIAGIVVGASFLGAGAGVAATSNGDKAALGTGIAMAVAGLASTIASAVVLAKRKEARYRQALAGCPVVAK